MAKRCLIFFHGKANSWVSTRVCYQTDTAIVPQPRALRPPPQELQSWKRLLTCSYHTSYYNLLHSNEENSKQGWEDHVLPHLKSHVKPPEKRLHDGFPALSRNEAGQVGFLVPLQWDWSNLLVRQFSPGQRIWFPCCWRTRTPPRAPGGCYPQSG